MENKSILYQIRSLDKLIIRTIIEDDVHITTPTQIQIMEYIIENSGKEIYQKDLEKILNLRRATVSGVLGTMEKHGLLMRSVSTEDARTKCIVLTKRARNIFTSKVETLVNLEKKMIQNISAEELEIFAEVLNKIKNNINCD